MPSTTRSWAWLHLWAMLGVAAWLRFRQLGALGFYGDEDLTALAVRGLLEHGEPRLPSGLVYWRAAPLTFLAAASSTLFGFGEWALRLPAAVAGTLSVPVFFALGRRLAGPGAGLFAGWLFALSGWHIDMSREARMYAPFLLFFLLALWAVDRAVVERRAGWAGLACAFAAIAVLFHELGILLLLFVWLAALPRFGEWRRFAWLAAASSGFCAFFWLWSRTIRFVLTMPGATRPPRPETDALGWLQSVFHLRFAPSVEAAASLLAERPWIYLALVTATIGAATLAWRRGPASSRLPAWLVFGALGLGLVNQFGILIALGITAALWRPAATRAWLGTAWRELVALAAGLASLLLFWQAHGWLSRAAGTSGVATITSIARESIHWPAMHGVLYVESFPAMSLVVLGGSVAWIVAGSPNPTLDEPLRRLFLWYWIPLLALGLTHEWVALRYTLPVYPFYVLIAAWTLWRAAGWGLDRLSVSATGARQALVGLAAAASLCLPVLTEQHGLPAAYAWSGLTYGTKVDEGIHGFSGHPDHAGAAAWLGERLGPHDLVVAMDVQEIRLYVGRVDYWLMETSNALPFSYHDGSQLRDIYTGAVVVDDLSELRDLVGRSQAEGRRLWIVTSAETIGKLAGAIPPGVADQLEHWADHVVFTGRDGRTRVLRFD